MRRVASHQRVYTSEEAAARLETSLRSLRRMALEKGKPARFYRPRPGNRDEVVYDAEEIDGMHRPSPSQVLPPAAAGAAAPPSGQTVLLAMLGRLLDRVSQPAALPPAPPREWLTPADAAAEMGLTEAFIRRAVAGGTLRVVRDGRCYKIHRGSLVNLATLARTTHELRADLDRRRRAANA